MFGIATRMHGDSITISMICNGYVVDLCGRDLDDNWINRSVFAQDFDGMVEFLSDYFNLPEEEKRK